MKIDVNTEEWCVPNCPHFKLEEEHFYNGFDDEPLVTMRACERSSICQNAVKLYRKWSEVQNVCTK